MAIVLDVQAQLLPILAQAHPHVCRVGVPGGVGQRFLHQPQQGLGQVRIGDAQRRIDLQLQLRPRERRGQGTQRGLQVHPAVVAQRLHHRADVGQQFAGQPLHRRHLRALRQRRIGQQQAQLDAQGGEFVSGHVVQFARQAQALGIAGAVGEQRTGGQQVGVDTRQRLARQLGSARVVRAEAGEGVEAGVDQRGQQRMPDAGGGQRQEGAQVGQQRQRQHWARRPLQRHLRDHHHQQHRRGADVRLQPDQGHRRGCLDPQRDIAPAPGQIVRAEQRQQEQRRRSPAPGHQRMRRELERPQHGGHGQQPGQALGFDQIAQESSHATDADRVPTPRQWGGRRK
ncbi:hypothetical protein NB706_003661 [Xanthomonas sacchari]|nr:hypothetical protein [Xanthomonas sacchari]